MCSVPGGRCHSDGWSDEAKPSGEPGIWFPFHALILFWWLDDNTIAAQERVRCSAWQMRHMRHLSSGQNLLSPVPTASWALRNDPTVFPVVERSAMHAGSAPSALRGSQ